MLLIQDAAVFKHDWIPAEPHTADIKHHPNRQLQFFVGLMLPLRANMILQDGSVRLKKGKEDTLQIKRKQGQERYNGT